MLAHRTRLTVRPDALALSLTSSASSSSSLCSISQFGFSSGSGSDQQVEASDSSQTDYSRPPTPSMPGFRRFDISLSIPRCESSTQGAQAIHPPGSRLSFLELEETPRPTQPCKLETLEDLFVVDDLGYESEQEPEEAGVKAARVKRPSQKVRRKKRSLAEARPRLGVVNLNQKDAHSRTEPSITRGRQPNREKNCSSSRSSRSSGKAWGSSPEWHRPTEVVPPTPCLLPQPLPEELSPIIALPPLLLPVSDPNGQNDVPVPLPRPIPSALKRSKWKDNQVPARDAITVEDALSQLIGCLSHHDRVGIASNHGIPTPPGSSEDEDADDVFSMAMHELDLAGWSFGFPISNMVFAAQLRSDPLAVSSSFINLS